MRPLTHPLLALAITATCALGMGSTGCATTGSRAGTATASAHRVPGEELALSSEEHDRLARGETVVREQTIEQGDRRYVGGFTYTVFDAPQTELWSLFNDVEAYRKVLPKTKQARLVGTDGEDRLIELVQGNAIVQAEYTIRVHPEPKSREVRFWLEPSLPHAIDDAWGFFRLEPFVTDGGEQRVLLTYGVMVDVGPGLVRELFEERVRSAMLSVPQLVRRYVVEARLRADAKR
jgi:ribosome-associated toxin RatA of RatAB toxin-antitoxin module